MSSELTDATGFKKRQEPYELVDITDCFDESDVRTASRPGARLVVVESDDPDDPVRLTVDDRAVSDEEWMECLHRLPGATDEARKEIAASLLAKLLTEHNLTLDGEPLPITLEGMLRMPHVEAVYYLNSCLPFPASYSRPGMMFENTLASQVILALSRPFMRRKAS